MKSIRILLTVCATSFGALTASAHNGSLIRSPLTNTGVDSDATGRIFSALSGESSIFAIAVSKLAPNSTHSVEVGGIVEGTFRTNSGGAGIVSFRTPRSSGSQTLDFDPRGKLVRVLAGSQSVLEAVVSATNEPSGTDVTEKVTLVRQPGATGVARAEYRRTSQGVRVFRVGLEGAGSGPFELFTDGISRGTFTVSGAYARIRFSTVSSDATALPLNFDPRGQLIEVRRNGTVLFSRSLEAIARGVNFALPRLSKVVLPSTGADPDGSAEAKLRIDERARKHFDVEIEDVPVGTYDLLVDGADVGDIVVTSTVEGTRGEVEYTSDDDDDDELPLTFDPIGKTLAVRQGSTTFFQGVFNPNTGSGAGTPRPEAASRLEETLTSTRLDTDASGDAKYEVDSRGRHKFSVEIEDVPVGNYTLRVAGVVRGTIRVVSTADGVEGELEFSTNVEPGKVPLTFDPRGQLIEVLSPAGTFFSHLFGNGAGNTAN